MADFYLVQRMIKNFHRKGPVTEIEHLVPEYMGSANFERGVFPKARQNMEKLRLGLTSVSMYAFGEEVTLYVVASVDESDTLQARFQEWADRDFRSHEDPLLRGVICGTIDKSHRPLAWWSLSDNIFWSLDEGIAKMWLEDIQPSAEVERMITGNAEFDRITKDYVRRGHD